ncbi:hypothetical protein AMATHDRAFT_67492 [Amanita thiersii Skay4041]|uniref:Uncharacterized protein n=1 Tax=Amanita thiersii Skay4041 TaxID=703135 RepID=A0A2A9NIX1_9AGAR|nr:hypothetical protein AMATHDRAFT_67492 [Amanita thiersii Skay4041]
MTIGSRPPPLVLKYDNFRSLQESSPLSAQLLRRKRTLLSKLYRINWRTVVISLAILNAIRFLFSAANAYQDAIVDHIEHHFRLGQLTVITCILYTLASLIEIYGSLAVYLRRIMWIRIYTYLSFISALFVVSAGVLSTITFFALSDDMIVECISLSIQGKLYLKSTFRGQPWPYKKLRPRLARKQCILAWSNDATYQSVAPFLFFLLPAVLYLILVYTHCRQSRDPAHPACIVKRDSDGASTAERRDSNDEGGERGRGRQLRAGARRRRAAPRERAGGYRALQGEDSASTTTTTTTMESGNGMEIEIVVKSASRRGRGGAEGAGLRRAAVAGRMREFERGHVEQRGPESFTASQRRALSRVGQHLPPPVGVAGAGATAAPVQMQSMAVMKSASGGSHEKEKKKDEEGRTQYGVTPGLPAYGDVFGAGAGAYGYGAYGGRLDMESAWFD